MFRIIFDPRSGKFFIQISGSMFFWTNVKDLSFDKYDDALAHVEQIGLNKLYQDKSANKFQEYVASA